MTDIGAARRNLELAFAALEEATARVDEARRRLTDAQNALEDLGAPEPQPQPVTRRVVGAMVVNASSSSTELLQQAGITHVAVELTAANEADFATSRWDGFEKGWFLISRGDDSASLAAMLAGSAGRATFAVVDTESHKADAGGNPAWTEMLYARIREVVGPQFPLYNVTFGIHSSPAVVNHDAFRRHAVVPIWEAYDGDGRTLGVRRTAAKAEGEGWSGPHVAIGDKSIPADVGELVAGASAGLGGVWVWAPEQTGVDVLELAKLPR
jgi:hypothetical protein